jgi:dihydrolipoamide dehydrogenase
MSERFDVVVIGAGPAGEVAAYRLAKHGLRVALAERELIGGECAYWACIPSKTLLRPPEARFEARRAAGLSEPEQRWREVAEYRDFMIRHLDDARQIEGYRAQGVAVYKSAARLAGPGRVEVNGKALETERVLLATGSDAAVPPIGGLHQIRYWTNREATTLSELPRSVVVLGGGPVAIELGQFLRRFGVAVRIVEMAERLIPREDPAVGELVAETLRAEGVELHLGARAEEVVTADGRTAVRLAGGEQLGGDELLIAVGRTPRLEGLGLETVGIDPARDRVEIDERCRAADGVWAIGDLTGVMPFTHVGKYQARIACADIAGDQARADYRAIPRVVFSDPEIAAVGLTAAEARDQGHAVATARVSLPDAIARPWTYERDPRGELGLVADHERDVLLGAWAVAPLAGEWIHYAALAIKAQIPLAVLRDTVAQFPTFSEGYLSAIEALAETEP